MPSKLAGNWTLKQLLQVTYEAFGSRYSNMKRDVVKSGIKVKKIEVYDGLNPDEARTKFIVTSSSYPQYAPYYTKKDSRGRSRKRQRTHKHQYDCTIQLDELSMSVPVKLRTGSAKKWRFKVSRKLIKSKANPRGRYLSVGAYNAESLGINGDFFFRLSRVYKIEGILFGRDWTNGEPKTTNPKLIPFLDKHQLFVITVLMERGVLKA